MRSFILFIILSSWLCPAWSYQSVGTDSTIDIVTWNLRDFPQAGDQTVTEVAKIVTDLKVDLIAVQEIASVSAFDNLKAALPAWDGILSGDIYFDGTYHKTGILYSKNRITVHSHQLLFQNSSAFPRPPLELNLTVTEKNHIFDFNLIVLHLKAYSDEESETRRRNAIQQLKDYIDHQVEYTIERDFIVVGDFNDALDDPQPTPNVFTPLLQAPEKYTFLTLPLAGSSASYIFGKTPSLIDHILVTANATEEYGKSGTTRVLYLDSNLENYTDIISDHRPVVAQFAFENAATPAKISSIAEIQNQFTELEGQMVTVRGVVTLGTGRLTPTYTSVYIQDESGAGINIYKFGAALTDFARGNWVEVQGDLYNYNGLHEIRHHSHQKLAEGQSLPAPRVIRTAEISQTADQGQRVEIAGRIQSKTESGGNVTFSVNDGSGSGKIYADTDANLNLTAFNVNDTVRVVGVKSVYSNTGEILLAYPDDISSNRATALNPSFAGFPEKYALPGNFPNPFNAGTMIQYAIPQSARISLRIFNLQGQEIVSLVDGQQAAGSHSVFWDGQNVPSGLYILQFRANQYTKTHKMLLLK
jgi:endonuclease/exonuclease/phosphatase family metal-dependent hydrolase/DNA/RNA endonuclease YhcR with UshA esterase domain